MMRSGLLITFSIVLGVILTPMNVFAQVEDYPNAVGISQYDELPQYLQDRGPGTPTSMFATFIQKGELIVYPFFEYYLDDDLEYQPLDFGHGFEYDYRGKYRASEYLIFVGYGITDRLVIKFEAAYIDAKLEKAPDDTTAMPERLEESGLGDVQTQVNYLWKKETESSPGFYSYFETVFPHNKDKDLIGTSNWELKAGTGLIRGFGWGMITIRAAVEYSAAEDKFDLGEWAAEYVKRLSSHWRVYAGIEGTQDEVELITEAQWHFNDHVCFKFNNAFGITSKATDWAPEVGIMFSIRK